MNLKNRTVHFFMKAFGFHKKSVRFVFFTLITRWTIVAEGFHKKVCGSVFLHSLLDEQL